MEVLCAIVLSLLLCQQGSALRGISEAEFAKFPLISHFDRYPECVAQPGGAFCVAGAVIVTDQPSELYDKMMTQPELTSHLDDKMMVRNVALPACVSSDIVSGERTLNVCEHLENFSFSAYKHFDYRKIRRGYCMTRRCKEYLTGDSDAALQTALGACLNSTLEREYGLRARIERVTCYRHGQRHNFTLLDSAASMLFISLIGLSVAGTLYDLFATKKDKKGYLMCFSIPANWAKLTAPWPQDPTTARLIGVNGMRLFTSLATTLLHASIPLPHTVANMYRLEGIMDEAMFHLQANAHIIVQTFIFLSGLFLAYTAQAAAERNPLTWGSLPKVALLRWLRLAPVYLLVVLYTATLFKYIPFGPMWQDYIGDEAHDCQRDWLSMVFFYNNYVYGSQCNPHHWSTSVDMQLHVVGLVVLLLPEATRASVLGALIATGIAAAGLETYFRDLDGAVVPSGKIIYSLKSFDASESFNFLQQRTHTNMASFFIGMAFGLFLYKWMKKPADNIKYKKYWWVHWATLSSCLLIVYSHRYLFTEGERRSLPVRMFYAMVPKPIWSGLLCLSVFGMACQLENGLHRLMSWHGWVPLTRLTFCAYNVHMLILRSLHATDTQLFHLSELAFNFSKSPILRLNYTKAVYGYCMTRRCKEFLTDESEAALQTALGACLNSTHGLRARIHRADCYRHGHRPSLNWLDWVAAALFSSFIAIIAAGTIYDLFAANKDPKGYLMCFSLPANWTKLMAPWPKDKATSSLVGINGMRSTAVDFHLHVIGLTVMLISPNKRIRNLVLWTLLAIGVALPVVVTYAYDLNGNFLMVSKMIELDIMIHEKTFTHLYTGSHTNIAGFASGMIMGTLLHDWQKNPVDCSKYKKYTILYWLLFPALLFVSYSNTFVLWGNEDMSTRLLIALLRNPAWIAIIALITIGVVFQVEKVALYRRVLEWPGWVPLTRISFCMYALHLPLTYWLLGSSHTLFTGSVLHTMVFTLGAVVMSVTVGAAAWLVVEAPCTNIVAKLFPEKRTGLLACSPDKTE